MGLARISAVPDLTNINCVISNSGQACCVILEIRRGLRCDIWRHHCCDIRADMSDHTLMLFNAIVHSEIARTGTNSGVIQCMYFLQLLETVQKTEFRGCSINRMMKMIIISQILSIHLTAFPALFKLKPTDHRSYCIPQVDESFLCPLEVPTPHMIGTLLPQALTSNWEQIPRHMEEGCPMLMVNVG